MKRMYSIRFTYSYAVGGTFDRYVNSQELIALIQAADEGWVTIHEIRPI